MQARWMTLPEIARSRGISLDEAQRFVDETDCPKAFKQHGTVYLV